MNDTPLPKIQPGDSIGASAINRLIAKTNDNRLVQGDDSILVNQAGGAVAHRFIPGPNLPGLAFFQCRVKKDGSEVAFNGSVSTVATFTYTVMDMNNATMAYACAPLHCAARIFYGPVTIAPEYSVAQCFIDPVGRFYLWDCQETRVAAVCS